MYDSKGVQIVAKKGLETLACCSSADAGGIFLHDARGDHLQLIAGYGMDEETLSALGEAFSGEDLLHGANKWTLHGRDAKPAGSVDGVLKNFLPDQGMDRLISIPLTAEEAISGLAILCHKRRWPVSSANLEKTLLALGDTIGIALSNAFRLEKLEGMREKAAFSLYELQMLLKAIPLPVYVRDKHGRYTFLNQKYLEFTRRNANELLGKTVFECWPVEDARVYHDRDIELMRHGGFQRYKFRKRWAGSGLRHVIFNKVCLKDQDGNVTGLLGIIEDMTDSFDAQQRLRQKLGELESLYAVSKGLQEQISLGAVIKNAVDEIHRITAADLVLLFLCSGEELHLKGIAPGHLGSVWRNIPVHKEECLCGWALRTRKSLFSQDVSRDERVTRDECRMLGYKSFAAIPLLAKGEKLGLLALASRTPRDFSRDAGFLGTLANTVALALRNSQLHERLSSQERFLQQMMDISIDWEYWRLDDGRFKYVSPSAERITGYSPRDFYRDPGLLEEIIHPEDREAWKGCRYGVPGQGSDPFLFRIVRKDGQERWIEHVHVRLSTSDKVQIIKATNRDVTEEVTARNAVLKSKILLQAVFDGLSDPMLMIGDDLRVNMLNSAASKYFEVSYDEVIGASCYEVLMGKDRPCEPCFCREAKKNPPYVRMERQSAKVPGNVEEVRAYYFTNEKKGVEGAIVQIRDITNEKNLERELMHSERLSAIGLLSAGMAHEINNPNNFILFNIPILKEYVDEIMPILESYAADHPDMDFCGMPFDEFVQDLDKLLDNMEHGSKRITDIIHRLRDYSMPGDPQFKDSIDVESVIQKAVALCRIRFKRRLRNLKIRCQEDLPNIRINEQALEQVLVNIIINAVQSTDKANSSISIDARLRRGKRRQLVIEVSDNGCGMSEEALNMIFKPFYTTKAHDMGSGLGLYVSNNIIEAMGGQIRVESKLGEGSKFSIMLPVE